MMKEYAENRVILANVKWDGRQFAVGIPKAVAEKMITDKGDVIKFTISESVDKVGIEYVRRAENRVESLLNSSEYAVLKFLQGKRNEIFTINEIRLWMRIEWNTAANAITNLKELGYVGGYTVNKKIYWGALDQVGDSKSEDTDQN
jgi:hypothetical protein